MKKFGQYLFFFCLTAVANIATCEAGDLKHTHHSSSSHEKQDPLVGPWTFNLQLTGNVINGVILFHSDGTFIFHDTSELTQSISPFAPQGDYFTLSAGAWKEVHRRHYEGVSTCAALARGTQCTGNNIPSGCLSFPAVPFARTKTTIKDLKINKNLIDATATITVSFHPVNDLTLKQPLINPQTGQPVPDVTGQVVMRKLTVN